MKSYKIIPFTLFLCCCFQSLFGGQLERVKIESSPTQATVFVGDQEVGSTPLTIELESDKSHTIYLVKEGHVIASDTIAPKMSRLPIYLAAPGGMLLYAFDAVLGKTHTLEKKKIHLQLQPSPYRSLFMSIVD